MGAATISSEREYRSLPFNDLISEERRLVLSIHNDMIKGDSLHQCFKSLSPLQSEKALSTIQDLHAVLEELNRRRSELRSSFLGIPYTAYLVGLKLGVHSAFFSSISLEFASIFVDCEKAEYMEFVSIACATAAVALAILNQWAERKHECHRQHKAEVENCSIDQLDGVKSLDRFLTSFTELVRHIQSQHEEKNLRNGARVGSAGSVGPGVATSPSRSALNYIANAVTGIVSRPVSKRELTRICISRLRAVPDYMLEGHTGENAQQIREHWIVQITKMANIKYVNTQSSGSELASVQPLRKGMSFVSIDIPQGEGAADYSKLSLHKLINLYKEKIATFSDQFDLDVYLASYVDDEESIQNTPEEALAQKQVVASFVATLKDLQAAIKNRREKYRKGGCLPCVPPKRQLDALYGTKHAATVVFFGATAMSGVTHCVEGFGVRDVGKVVAIVSGIIGEFLEGVCSWATSKQSNNRIELAHLIKADLVDVKGVDALNSFVELFLSYVDEVGELRELKNLFHHAATTASAFSDGGLDDTSAPTKKELSKHARSLKRLLTSCHDALAAIDSSFLEHLVKGNGDVVKEKWRDALQRVFERVTEGIAVKARKRDLCHHSHKGVFLESELRTANLYDEEDGVVDVGAWSGSPKRIAKGRALEAVANEPIYDSEDDEGSEYRFSTDEESEADILYDNQCLEEPEPSDTSPKSEARPAGQRQICILQ